MRDRQDSRAVDDGSNEQELDSSTGRNSPDDSDEQGPANSSDWIVAMDSDEETNSVMLSLSKAIVDATHQLQDIIGECAFWVAEWVKIINRVTKKYYMQRPFSGYDPRRFIYLPEDEEVTSPIFDRLVHQSERLERLHPTTATSTSNIAAQRGVDDISSLGYNNHYITNMLSRNTTATNATFLPDK